jgi:hypothetical protein
MTELGNMTARDIVTLATYGQLCGILGMINDGYTLEQIKQETTNLAEEIALDVPIMARKNLEETTGIYFG